MNTKLIKNVKFDPVAGFATSLRNVIRIKRVYVNVPYSKLVLNIVELLKKENYISEFEIFEQKNKNSNIIKGIKIKLNYYKNCFLINSIQKVSKISLRVYKSYNKIGRVLSGNGIYIISTSKGIMTDFDARKNKIGGEVLLEVY